MKHQWTLPLIALNVMAFFPAYVQATNYQNDFECNDITPPSRGEVEAARFEASRLSQAISEASRVYIGLFQQGVQADLKRTKLERLESDFLYNAYRIGRELPVFREDYSDFLPRVRQMSLEKISSYSYELSEILRSHPEFRSGLADHLRTLLYGFTISDRCYEHAFNEALLNALRPDSSILKFFPELAGGATFRLGELISQMSSSHFWLLNREEFVRVNPYLRAIFEQRVLDLLDQARARDLYRLYESKSIISDGIRATFVERTRSLMNVIHFIDTDVLFERIRWVFEENPDIQDALFARILKLIPSAPMDDLLRYIAYGHELITLNPVIKEAFYERFSSLMPKLPYSYAAESFGKDLVDFLLVAPPSRALYLADLIESMGLRGYPESKDYPEYND